MNPPEACLLADDVTAPRWPAVWRVLLMLQVALAAIAGWMLPHGFPWWHPRFAANDLAPLLLACISLVGLWAAWRKKHAMLALVIACFGLLWIAALVSGLVAFPISGRRLRLIGAVAALLYAVGYGFSFRRVRLPWRAFIPSAAVMIALGIMLPLTQRASNATTRPSNVAMPAATKGSSRPDKVLINLDDDTRLHAAESTVECLAGLRLQIHSLVHFDSCSPDRCWTSLATPHERQGPRRRLEALNQIDGGYEAGYGGATPSLLRVRRTSADELALEAFTRLDEPIYSHLNTYTDVFINGHRRLELAFSPCPETRIEVLPADYPVGRPMRLAYVDAQRRFRVVESTSGEKGPFKELASGKLRPEDPLTITCYDEGVPRCRIELADWSAQLSTDLSPTAGWGVTQNAIEFRLSGSQPQSPAAIWFTLAGTSVGRGWDSVGHAPGVYRNRLRIVTLESPPPAHESDR